jgi:oligopeptide transport system ATP-binding protein
MAHQLLEVENLRTYFYLRSGVVKAVDGVSFSVEKGQTLGIVGESGSGKSVTMLSIMGLIPSPPGKILGGLALFQGEDLLQANPKRLRELRGNRVAMIFQDPMTSLNPYLRISTQLGEVLTEHGTNLSSKEVLKKSIQALERVGIPDASKRVQDYPHQFSGGMRQRVMIAMALMGDPDLLIADEPTTALDVTIQAQILDLLKDLQKDKGLGMILITHDLGVVAGMSDEILVMYGGKAVEWGTASDLFYRNHHPYTRGLLASSLSHGEKKSRLQAIPGLPPDPSRLPPGCSFAARCSSAMEACRGDQGIPVRVLSSVHQSVCHL